MQIQLVNVNGRLVGRTFSDRWNLEQCGIVGGFVYDKNQTVFKRLRRLGFTVGVRSIVPGGMVAITRAERELLNPSPICNRKVA